MNNETDSYEKRTFIFCRRIWSNIDHKTSGQMYIINAGYYVFHLLPVIRPLEVPAASEVKLKHHQSPVSLTAADSSVFT